MQRYHFCEIDLAAIRHNVGVMKSHIAGGARFLAVVKADAYGHGAVPVAKAALEAGADMLAVAIPEEGIELREAGIAAPILVLGGIEESAAEAVVQNDLTQVVFDERRIRALAQAGQKLGRCAKVHLKLDTGMNRIGVRTAEEAQALTRLIDSLPGVALTGCFTHMATADEPDPTGTLRQIERFEALCKAVKAAHPGEIICHGANTASIFRYPQLHADMVRGGLALYGYPPVPEATGLQPAMRWVTRGIYVKTIAPGDRVSYGGTFVATRPTVVMTLPVGYADGYSRILSGKVDVLYHGHRVPQVGAICMDQCMIDVSGEANVHAGDEVVLFGRQGDSFIPIEEIAAVCGTINYEIMCNISRRVPRVYMKNGKVVGREEYLFDKP